MHKCFIRSALRLQVVTYQDRFLGAHAKNIAIIFLCYMAFSTIVDNHGGGGGRGRGGGNNKIVRCAVHGAGSA